MRTPVGGLDGRLSVQPGRDRSILFENRARETQGGGPWTADWGGGICRHAREQSAATTAATTRFHRGRTARQPALLCAGDRSPRSLASRNAESLDMASRGAIRADLADYWADQSHPFLCRRSVHRRRTHRHALSLPFSRPPVDQRRRNGRANSKRSSPEKTEAHLAARGKFSA